MDSIPHRELRNSSSAVLARVAGGESLAVTNHGEVAAVLSPPHTPELERLERAGRLRAARAPLVDFTRLRRVSGDTAAMLADLRGDR